jgi:putative tail protein
MSGQLIGGVIGVGLSVASGGAFTPAIGWMVGSIAGGLLIPPEGPHLEDIGPQKSEYGQPIPVKFGTIAGGGNVVWASEFTIVEGGKGGEPEADAAYGNMAVLVCEGVRTLGRIWAGPERRLIWDGAILEGADSGATLRWYSGTEVQLPDALIESYEGVGNVPGYRGYAYLVLENFPLAKDGNRLPFLWIETGADSDAITAPSDLGVVWIVQVILTTQYYAVFYRGSYEGLVIRRRSDNTLYKHFTYDALDWSHTPDWIWDEDRQVFIQRISTTMTYATIAIANGLRTVHNISAAGGADANLGTTVFGHVYHNGAYIFAARGSAGQADRVSLYLMDPDAHTATATYAADSGASGFGVRLMKPIDATAAVYVASTAATLTQHALASATPVVDLGVPATISATNTASVEVDPNTGRIWSVVISGDDFIVHVNDPATQALILSSTTPRLAWQLAARPFAFIPGSPNLVIITGEQWLGTDQFTTFDGDAPALLERENGFYHGTAVINELTYNPTTDRLMAFRYSGWISFSDDVSPHDPVSARFGQFNSGFYEREGDNKYLGEADATGIVTPVGQALSEIVADLSGRAGLDASQYDVTALTDIVPGYAIERSTTCRDAIMALMPAYYFDAVESGGVAKFVKRGGSIAATIDDDELGAHESGTEPPDDLESTRQMENELPKTLFVRYLLEATNYSTASRYARRLVGASGDEQTLDLPLVLTDTTGQEVAEVGLHGAWVGRITYRFSLPRKYVDIEPTDIIVVKGHTMRIEKMKYVGGRFQCEARHDDSNVYVPNVVVTETPPTGGEVAINTEIVLELM